MDIFVSLLIIFSMLIFSIFKNINILYPLILGLGILSFLSFKRGFDIKDVLSMVLKGASKTNQIYILLVLLGASTAIWMACGTVPAFIYYGIKIINPHFFIISAFIITCAVSLVIGSSFGTVGTIGIVFIIMAKASHINLDLTAGVIITAAYIGERSSPLSSSANLVAILTETNLYVNLKRMFFTTIVPFIIVIGIYLMLSVKNPLHIGFLDTSTELRAYYNLNSAILIPAIVILLFVVFKMDVRIALVVSIIIAFVESILFQSKSVGELIHFMIFGYKIDSASSITDILHGGGILTMLQSILIVMISSCYAGIFEGTNMLADFENAVEKVSIRFGPLFATTVTSIAGCFFGCSQTFAIITSHQFMQKIYANKNMDKSDLALDIGNTSIVIAPLVPWNIAATFPAAVLSVGTGYIPYAFFLYLVPLFRLIRVIVWRFAKQQSISKVH
ncbi:Na+/H+ antiporter NhaC family protein [Peribacillus sp. NPDC097895]|uniref:Na+/H+ antiporter NhaC family protein n=1 Tax=Peribacillus sp. NPDC097895 TaxID=3390619 RepID=UPI003CFE31DB